jgi:molybdopterin molybdotransferase
MTGAMLPSGSDRVVRKEFVEERNGLIRIVTPEPGDNVVRLGSSLARGGRVLGPKVLAAQDIGILAASGAAEVFVSVPLSTGIICTGPEIRPAGATLGPGQIYDSNGPQLAAQLAAIQVPSRLRGIVPDEPEALSRALADAFAEHDLVLLTGGVSEGDFDFVPRCLEGQGAEILFHGVAVKPGKPTLFARLPGGRRAFGLPGNPVSTFVIFEVFVKPYLLARMGADPRPLLIRARTGAPIRRRNTERAEFLPVRVREGAVTPVPFHGSAHLNALGDADGLVLMAKGVAEIPGGTEVDVRPI